jgi:type-F conjugative transfer system protein TrbI
MNEEMQKQEPKSPVAQSSLVAWLNDVRQFYTESMVGIAIGGLTKLALVVFTTIVIYKSFFAPRIVSVDVAGILDQQVRQAITHPMSEQERNQNAALFSKALEAALDRLATDGRSIVLVRPAVVRGSIDMTADVQGYINSLMMSSK